MIAFTGAELRNFLSKRSAEQLKKRFLYPVVQTYLEHDEEPKILCLYGLRRTGKTIMMAQAIIDINDYDNCIYLFCEKGDTMRDVHSYLRNAPQKYVFIDEATRISNFINTSSVLSDIYAFSGKRVVVAGTESLGFMIAKNDQLYNRMTLLHTTFIPYKEFHYLLGKSLDEYIMYGGMLSLEGDIYNQEVYSGQEKRKSNEPYEEYLDGAIVHNVMHTLEHWDSGEHFGVLKRLYDEGDLESAIYKVVDRDNREFLASIINSEFSGSMVGSLMDLIDRHNLSDALPIEKEAVKEEDRIRLRIRQPLRNYITEPEVNQIIHFLMKVDLMINASEEGNYIFLQPGLRYYQEKVLIDVLVSTEAFRSLPIDQRQLIIAKLDQDVKGRLLEDIIYTQLHIQYQNTDYSVSKYEHPSGGEIDIIVSDKKTRHSIAIEVKHSSKMAERQIRHLLNPEICAGAENVTGTSIVSKVVIYSGQPGIYEGVRYLNAEDFLLNSDESLQYLFSEIDASSGLNASSSNRPAEEYYSSREDIRATIERFKKEGSGTERLSREIVNEAESEEIEE
ncbi:MAG: AAA family ATPase [Eubacterium sp.]|nr:AAA family ATPase [Eubacterium sp.]